MRINNFENLMKYIAKYKNNVRKMINVKENFKEYLELCNEENIMLFINQVKIIPEMDTTLKYNSGFICRKFGIGIILKMTEEMNFNARFEYIYEMYECIRMKRYTIDEYIEDLMENNEGKYICDNMKELVKDGNIQILIEQGLLEKLRQLNPAKFKEIHSIIVCKMTGIKLQFLDSSTLYVLTKIVNEIAQNESVDISNIQYVGRGTLTDVYKLGNKVIKFGRNRITDKIPYHKRILQPLLRRRVLSGFRNLYIEISEYIPFDNSITDEDAYLIYKELRDDGIIWLDAKKENLGRLQKDNIVHFNEKLHLKNETVGYIPETIEQEEPLHKGDLVILDTDFLFREQDFDVNFLNKNINTNFYRVCEQRYQAEKNSKIPKAIISKSVNIMERE